MSEEIKELTGKVFDTQGFSVHDGPGIRITVFFKGCPLKCLWCHSPESQRFETEINWLKHKCVNCGRCVEACPTGARTVEISQDDEGNPKFAYDIDAEKCTKCGKCIKSCLVRALYWCGEEKTVEQIMDRVRKDKPFFEKSGGGLTVSGGECLAQADFIAELLKAAKAEGIDTCVDTCGFVPWENIEKVLPYTDRFLYDLKHMDSERHMALTYVPNELILENAKKIAAAGGKFHIRIPVIPGANADMENIVATKDFLVPIKDAVELVQILPYHALGKVKWERLNWKGETFETEPPTDEQVDEIVKVFVDAGINTIVH